MDNAAYRDWWQLHLRLARGETLSSDETATYKVGLADIERDEQLTATFEVKELRHSLTKLQDEPSVLEDQRHELDTVIAALESRLSEN